MRDGVSVPTTAPLLGLSKVGADKYERLTTPTQSTVGVTSLSVVFPKKQNASMIGYSLTYTKIPGLRMPKG